MVIQSSESKPLVALVAVQGCGLKNSSLTMTTFRCFSSHWLFIDYLRPSSGVRKEDALNACYHSVGAGAWFLAGGGDFFLTIA